ncbi:IS30 family transposase [Nocardia rhamnosiphila]
MAAQAMKMAAPAAPATNRSPVEARQVAGHRAGDLVMGSRPSAIATSVERTSRFTVLVALPDGIEAEQVTPHPTRVLLGLPAPMRRTLTWDRGREIDGHRAITAATQTPIYLCEPRSPWRRGANENTDRLLRRYLPKSAGLRRFDRTGLDALACNSTIGPAGSTETAARPRSTLNS